MVTTNSGFLSLAAVLLLSLAVHAAPTSTTGGDNANSSICKVLSQKGCKGVGVRGDQCCERSGLWCNLNAPSTCSKCRQCIWGEKTVSDCAATANTVCAACPNTANVVDYAASGKTCVVSKCKAGFYYKSEADGCVACISCSNDTNYETTQCSTESNRVCTTCRDCSLTHGTFEDGGCTTTPAGGTDRVCTYCNNYADVKTYTTPGKDCVVSECNSEHYYPNDPVQGCLGCDATCIDGDTYQTRVCSTAGNRECSVCSTCTDGTSYQSSPCSPTANRVCTPCSAKCVAGEFSSGCESPGFNMNGAVRTCTACTGVDGVATYVDAGVSCEAASCSTGYDLIDGGCKGKAFSQGSTTCPGVAPACHTCANGSWVSVSNGNSCGSGFCSSGVCKFPATCGEIIDRGNGCNILCGFTMSGGFNEAHCMYTKSDNKYVCRTDPACVGGGCDCSSKTPSPSPSPITSNGGGNGNGNNGRRMLK